MDKAKYFFRTVPFTRENGEISVVDAFNLSQITPLDPWLGTVLSLADGKHTLQELTDFLAGQYPNGAPEDFEKTLESVVERLLESKAMELSDNQLELPYYLSTPINEQDLEKAKEMMLSDGYISH